MTHMRDEIEEQWMLSGETDKGECFTQVIEEGVSFIPQTIGSPIEMTIQHGWCARLSAPGYLDCTDWLGPFENIDEATAALDEEHGTKCGFCGERVGACNRDAPFKGYERCACTKSGCNCVGGEKRTLIGSPDTDNLEAKE